MRSRRTSCGLKSIMWSGILRQIVAQGTDADKTEGREDPREVEVAGSEGKRCLGIGGALRAFMQDRGLLASGEFGEVRSDYLL